MKVAKKGEKSKNYVDLSSSELVKDEEFLGLRELYNRLKLKYDKSEILSVLEQEEIFIPSSIFNKKLSSLETISKYLIENRNLSLKQVSRLLNRSNKNIWNAYNNSKKKFDEKLVVRESILIPLSVLRDLNFTLLENIVSYLKDTFGLTYHKIALLLNRNDRTIWTVYQRAKKKKNDR